MDGHPFLSVSHFDLETPPTTIPAFDFVVERGDKGTEIEPLHTQAQHWLVNQNWRHGIAFASPVRAISDELRDEGFWVQEVA